MDFFKDLSMGFLLYSKNKTKWLENNYTKQIFIELIFEDQYAN